MDYMDSDCRGGLGGVALEGWPWRGGLGGVALDGWPWMGGLGGVALQHSTVNTE